MLQKFGYYENAEKIINIPITIITALGTVMLPRLSNMVSNGKNEQLNKYIKVSISFVMFMSFSMCMGLIGIGYNFAPFYFGENFQKTGILIMLLATTLPFLSFANVIRTQYLIPKERDKEYIISVSLGAVVNLIMNLIFIPRFKSIGACFGTIAAEFIVMFYQTLQVKDEINIKEYIKDIIPFFIKSLIMLVIIYPLNYIDMNDMIRLIIQIGLGCSIYCILNIKYILSNLNIKKILEKIKNKKEG